MCPHGPASETFLAWPLGVAFQVLDAGSWPLPSQGASQMSAPPPAPSLPASSWVPKYQARLESGGWSL